MDMTVIQLLPAEVQALGAFALFVLFTVVKNFAPVAKLLNTPRKKQLAVALLATGLVVLALYESTAPRDMLGAAINVFLAAMGVNALRPSKSKPPEPVLEPELATEEDDEPEPDTDEEDEEPPSSQPKD